jgi:hypothetical protein
VFLNPSISVATDQMSRKTALDASHVTPSKDASGLQHSTIWPFRHLTLQAFLTSADSGRYAPYTRGFLTLDHLLDLWAGLQGPLRDMKNFLRVERRNPSTITRDIYKVDYTASPQILDHLHMSDNSENIIKHGRFQASRRPRPRIVALT